ncbi:hypothetical protein DDE74_04160 [Streptomyces lydicus]|uniref:DUF3311 domain-containing protein n=1 Tax=Streptomyces lydicus TaxID=47763 RepID=A0A3S9Y5F7_9ACTN|nr:DUF3311 domain-containing protein [Streptomyces lydicus]AZS70237.1 hypothetical protein DDE74_04160 [Streptomyces lydicus]
MTGKIAGPLIGLGLPATALLVAMPLLADTPVRVFGIPLLFFWIFLWIPLTSLCLGTSWFLFDRHRPDPDHDTPPAPAPDPAATAGTAAASTVGRDH